MHLDSDSDTIAAIATPPGEGGVAIIRVSGPRCFEIADQVFRCSGPTPSQRAAGTFTYGKIVSGGEPIDAGLCLIMRAPRSYTGEDTIELHGHGGIVLARRVLQTVLDRGARPAAPGEFTRRAFVNGKIDLVQAESVMDAVSAKTDRAASAAIEQMAGRMSNRFGELFDLLVALAADLEATLDFPEDELPEMILPDVIQRLTLAMTKTEALLTTWNTGRVLREGARIVIAGRPNAGKSTLLNALLGVDRSIVSHLPGTTRDVIEEGFNLEGIPVRLVDTAGLREASCEIEIEGIRRTRTQLEGADICLYVVDSSEAQTASETDAMRLLDPDRTIIIFNKTDLGAAQREIQSGVQPISASLIKGSGVEAIKGAIVSRLGITKGTPDSSAAISERHRTLLVDAMNEMAQASTLLSPGQQAFIAQASSHISSATAAVGRAIGRVFETEMIDLIFSKFCIGK